MAGTVKQEGTELEFSDRAVPLDGRMGRLPLTMAWWSVCSAMFYLVVAASLALAGRGLATLRCEAPASNETPASTCPAAVPIQRDALAFYVKRGPPRQRRGPPARSAGP